MQAELIFEWEPQNVVYVTSRRETPYPNRLDLCMASLSEQAEIVFENECRLTADDELPRLDETRKRPEWEQLSRVYLQFIWGTGEECLCSREQGENIAASWIRGEEQWYIRFMAEGYFIIIPDQTTSLSRMYSVTFALENIICDAAPGITAVKIYTQNLPGYEDAEKLLPLHKTLPLEILSFRADHDMVREGEDVTLSWSVRQADRCILSGCGAVSAEGSRTVTVENPETFELMAFGQYGQTKVSHVRVETSRGVWTKKEKAEPGFPDIDDASAWNHELVENDTRLYVCVNSVLYQSEDGSVFLPVSEETGEWEQYSLGNGEEGIWLTGTDTLLESGISARYSPKEEKWSVYGFPFYGKGRNAITEADGKVWAAWLAEGSDAVELYVRENGTDEGWRLVSVIEKAGINGIKLSSYDETVCFAAASGSRIWLYGTEDGRLWTWTYEIKENNSADCLYLMSGSEGVFLATRQGIYSKRDDRGFVKESVYPEKFMELADTLPFAGIYKNKIWMITSERGTRSIWTYSTEEEISENE